MMLQYVQSFVQPPIVSLELGGSWGPVMSSLPRLLIPVGEAQIGQGAILKETRGYAFARDVTCAKLCLQALLLAVSFLPMQMWGFICCPLGSCWSAPPLVKKGGKGEKLVQSFQSPERRAGAKLFQAVQYLGHHAIIPTRAKMLLSCHMPKLHTRSPLTKTTLVSVIN